MTENPQLSRIESREMSKRAKVAAEASNYLSYGDERLKDRDVEE
jgi:hypothetical protein